MRAILRSEPKIGYCRTLNDALASLQFFMITMTHIVGSWDDPESTGAWFDGSFEFAGASVWILEHIRRARLPIRACL